MTHLVESEKTPKDETLDGLNFASFGPGEQMNTFVKSQRKRIPKRSFASFGLTTLSMVDDSATRLKKRNRKDGKRWVVDKVDGFTFVSAFTLNDFDEYDKTAVKRPLAPTKRKCTGKIESATSVKKVKKSECSTPGNFEKSENSVAEGPSNLTPKKSPTNHGNASSAGMKKNSSPLTKSALVRLKKINVSNLNKKKPIHEHANSLSSCSKTKPIKLGSKKRDKSPRVQDDKPTHGGVYGSGGWVIMSDNEDNVELDVCGIDENSSSQFIMSNKNSRKEKNLSDLSQPKSGEKGKPKKKPCRVCCAYPSRIVGAQKIKSNANHFPSFEVSFTSRCQVHTPGEIEIHDSKEGKVNVCIQTTFTDIRMHLDFARRFPYRAISIVSCQPSLYDDDLKLPDNLAPEGSPRNSENHRILEQKRREELHGLYCKLADTLSISKIRASKQWILENACREIRNIEDKDKRLSEQLTLVKAENGKKRKRWEELAGKPYVVPEESPARVESKSKLLELYEKYRQERRQRNDYESKREEKIRKIALKKEEKMNNALREEIKVRNTLEGEVRKAKDILKEEEKRPWRRPNILRSRKKEENRENRENKASVQIEGDGKTPGISATHSPSTDHKVDVLSNSPVCAPNFNDAAACNLQTATHSTSHTVIPVCSVRNPSITEIHQNTASSIQSSLKPTNSKPVSSNQFGSQVSASSGTVSTAKHASLGPRQIVHPFQHTLADSASSINPVIPKIDLTEESETSAPKLNKPERLVSKSSQGCELPQVLVGNPRLPVGTQVTKQISQSPPSSQSSVHLQGSSPSTSATTCMNAIFPVARKPVTQSSSPGSYSEYVVVRVVERDNRITIYQIPKTTEGLRRLCKLSAIKKLNPDTIKKIAAQFPSSRQQQPASTTSNQVTTASLAKLLATPTQWSTVASIPNASTPAAVPSQSVQSQSSRIIPASRTVNSNSHPSMLHLVKEPKFVPPTNADNTTFATISRPIKEPTSVKTGSGSAATTSRLRTPNYLNTKIRNNNNLIVSEKGKQPSVTRPSKVISAIGQRNDVSQQQQNKLILLDLTSKNTPEAKAFSMMPSSSSINVTLNRLGSITANKVFNKSPVPVRAVSNPQKANFATNLVSSTSQPRTTAANFFNASAPLALQTKPENASIINKLASLTDQIQPAKGRFIAHPQQTGPVSILSKQLPPNLPPSIPYTSVTNPPPSASVSPVPSIPSVPVSPVPFTPSVAISPVPPTPTDPFSPFPPTPSDPISSVPPPQIPSEAPPAGVPEIAPDIPYELIRASLSPLEAIPQISVSLLEDMCENDAEPGFCVISNVFSLTDDTAGGGSPEKKTDAAVVPTKVDTNVSTAVEASLVASSQGEFANTDLQNGGVRKNKESPNVSGSSCASNTNDHERAEQLKLKVTE